MGLPSGTFSHPDAGRLRVVFSGTWKYNAGDPVFTYGDWQLNLRAYVGEGATRRTAQLSMGVNTAVIELAYAGGYDLVPVGMEYVAHSFGGAGSVSATDLTISCHLLSTG